MTYITEIVKLNGYTKKIEQKVLDHEIYQKTKDYSKTKEKIYTYLEIRVLVCFVFKGVGFINGITKHI